mmetsp:Transcript_16293/g.56963  ORF Transcript_16293/g.56963 Transcript_16293/m.56963 type:complete len:288 (+) Transcript_16293:1963-2826(+)
MRRWCRAAPLVRSSSTTTRLALFPSSSSRSWSCASTTPPACLASWCSSAAARDRRAAPSSTSRRCGGRARSSTADCSSTACRRPTTRASLQARSAPPTACQTCSCCPARRCGRTSCLGAMRRRARWRSRASSRGRRRGSTRCPTASTRASRPTAAACCCRSRVCRCSRCRSRVPCSCARRSCSWNCGPCTSRAGRRGRPATASALRPRQACCPGARSRKRSWRRSMLTSRRPAPRSCAWATRCPTRPLLPARAETRFRDRPRECARSPSWAASSTSTGTMTARATPW